MNAEISLKRRKTKTRKKSNKPARLFHTWCMWSGRGTEMRPISPFPNWSPEAATPQGQTVIRRLVKLLQSDEEISLAGEQTADTPDGARVQTKGPVQLEQV